MLAFGMTGGSIGAAPSALLAAGVVISKIAIWSAQGPASAGGLRRR